MLLATPTAGTPNPLVHLELSRRQTASGMQVQLAEQPLLGELALEMDADEALLIALGELLVIDRPLRVLAAVHLDGLTLLWLDSRQWLLLPATGDTRPAPQRLHEVLGQDRLRHRDGGLWLSGDWLAALPDAFQLWRNGAEALPGDGAEHPLLIPEGSERFQLLVRRTGVELLARWLQQ